MSLSQPEIEQILIGCRKNDRSAQQKVYMAYYSKMLGVCRRYTKDVDTAKDILQDAFIKIFDKIGGFSGEGSLEGWIRRIVVNAAIDFIRKEKRSSNLFENEGSIPDSDTPPLDGSEEESIYDQIGMDEVLLAMDKLSPAYQMVFNLYVVENMSHKEIAATLNITEGTSKSNYAKAKMNLKKILITELKNNTDVKK
ncbi:MAG: RNA polymerase sigma factor [Flavobacteriales bacterium]